MQRQSGANTGRDSEIHPRQYLVVVDLRGEELPCPKIVI